MTVDRSGRPRIRAGAILSIVFAFALVGIVAAGEANAQSRAHNEIQKYISGVIVRPQLIAESHVVAGSPDDFLAGEFAAAELQVTHDEARSILGSNIVFRDCGNRGRQCTKPRWAPFVDQLGFTKLQVPASASCTQSHERDDADVSVKMLCVDTRNATFYFYIWSDDAH